MTPTTNETARALIDSAAALAGMTTETPAPLYKDDPPPQPMPCYVIDPATGRRLHVRRMTYPASQAGRLSIAPASLKNAKGGNYWPEHPAATVAPTTEPAILARRLRRYLNESREAHDKAAAWAAAHDDHESRTAATVAALVAAGWSKPHERHPDRPGFPDLPGNAYGYGEQVSGDSVSLELRGLTIAQALAVTAALRP